jgi:large subunit ribosomal protein L21
MYALLEIKGKQYKAEKGALLKIARIPQEKGDAVEFDSVILVSEKDNVRIGTPYVKGVTVKAKIEDHKKDKKVIIYKYRPKKASKRKYGHRQPYSLIRIEEITGVNE